METGNSLAVAWADSMKPASRYLLKAMEMF
jgi:hypothetical protein